MFHVVVISYGKEVTISRVGIRDSEGHFGGKIMGLSDQSMQLLKLVQLRTIQTKPSELTLKLKRETQNERGGERGRGRERGRGKKRMRRMQQTSLISDSFLWSFFSVSVANAYRVQIHGNVCTSSTQNANKFT